MRTKSGAMTYLTYDSDGRPFKVWQKDTAVQVYPIRFEGSPLNFRTDQFLVGTSPLNEMTESSGGFGPDFDGNSVIAKITGHLNTYYFIGDTIFIFKTLAPLITFFSPLGSNDVPHPWAVDQLGNVYLFIEEVILKANPDLNAIPKNERFNPYALYYKAEKTFSCEHPLTKETIDFDYHPDAGKHYDRIIEWKTEHPKMARDYEKLGKEIVVTTIRLWGEQHGYLTLPILQRIDDQSWSRKPLIN